METKTTLWVGGARNAHGTRISRKVTCTKCGVEDFITSRPSKTNGALCRSCAQTEIGAIEMGKKAPRVMAQHTCSNCKCHFALPARIKLEKDSLCPACLKGHDIWRGSADMTVEERDSLSFETRKSGVMLRRKEPS